MGKRLVNTLDLLRLRRGLLVCQNACVYVCVRVLSLFAFFSETGTPHGGPLVSHSLCFVKLCQQKQKKGVLLKDERDLIYVTL